jgi:hypothetical protein
LVFFLGGWVGGGGVVVVVGGGYIKTWCACNCLPWKQRRVGQGACSCRWRGGYDGNGVWAEAVPPVFLKGWAARMLGEPDLLAVPAAGHIAPLDNKPSLPWGCLAEHAGALVLLSITFWHTAAAQSTGQRAWQAVFNAHIFEVAPRGAQQ